VNYERNKKGARFLKHSVFIYVYKAFLKIRKKIFPAKGAE